MPASRAAKPGAKAKAVVKPAAKPVVKAPVAKELPAVKAKAPAAKPKPKVTRSATPSISKGPVFTHDDVSLRAYFIAEKRRAHGLPGDEHQDWLEAERQLLSENAKPRKAVKA
jgi:hypothetical protein